SFMSLILSFIVILDLFHINTSRSILCFFVIMRTLLAIILIMIVTIIIIGIINIFSRRIIVIIVIIIIIIEFGALQLLFFGCSFSHGFTGFADLSVVLSLG